MLLVESSGIVLTVRYCMSEGLLHLLSTVRRTVVGEGGKLYINCLASISTDCCTVIRVLYVGKIIEFDCFLFLPLRSSNQRKEGRKEDRSFR